MWLLVQVPGIMQTLIPLNYLQVITNDNNTSAITLPVTMRCMEEKNKLAQPISHFFLPLGMTMHMPGAAMYYPMVALFVAQMQGMGITFAKVIPLWSVKFNFKISFKKFYIY